MKRFRRLLLAALLVASLGGCAKFQPAGVIDLPRQLLDMRMTVRGAIDDQAYYLFVIDTNERDSDGPEIIAPYTEFLGNGRATGSYTHYVEYHLGRFELFRDQPEQEGVTPPPRTALGQPFFFDSTSSSGTLSCSVDMDELKANSADADIPQLEVNFITVNKIVLPGEIPIDPRQTDGVGTQGTRFISFRVQNGLVIDNTGSEEPGEVFEGQQLDPAYDLTDFRISVRSGS